MQLFRAFLRIPNLEAEPVLSVAMEEDKCWEYDQVLGLKEQEDSRDEL